MKKKIKIIIGVVIAICIIAVAVIAGYFGLKKHEESKYSFDYVKNMVKEGNDGNKYIHVKTEWFENGENVAVSEVAKDGQKLYMHEGDSQIGYDILVDIENSKQYLIYHSEKTIQEASTETFNEDYMNTFMKRINENAIEFMNREDAQYEFCGMEKVNEDKCVKVAVSSEESGTNEKIYFYIRLSDKCVVKMESEEDGAKVELVVYYYNDVDSEFAKKFDIDSYTDYERHEVGM